MELKKNGDIQGQEEIFKMISQGRPALVGGGKRMFAAAVVVLLLKEEFSSLDCELLCLILKIPKEDVLSGVLDRN